MNPADNPKEVERTEKRRDGEDAETDAEPDMNADPFDAEENSMLDEIDTVMAGSKPLQNLDVSQVGPAAYRVLSARNGSVTVHDVDLVGVTCTCKDMTHNTDGRDVCAHIAKALLSHPARMQPEEAAMKSLMDCQRQFAELREQTAEMAEVVERERTKQLSEAPEDYHPDPADDPTGNGGYGDGKGQSVHNPSGPSSSDPAVDPHEAADKLQAAYDDVVEDMKVEVSGGQVWVQTGRGTPDTLPGPGNVEVFDAFLKDPSQMNYDPDNSDSPGQWWKNRIDPNDVDEYISEVLE